MGWLRCGRAYSETALGFESVEGDLGLGSAMAGLKVTEAESDGTMVLIADHKVKMGQAGLKVGE